MNTLNAVLIIVQLVTLELILRESTIFRTPYFRYLYFVISVMIIGAMLTILHWPMGREVTFIGLAGAMVIYTIRTYKKPYKGLLDFAKWIWVSLNCIAGILNLQHAIYADLASYLATGAFFIMMLVFFISPKSAGMPEEKKYNSEEEIPLDQL